VADEASDPQQGELIPRPPLREDLVALCRKLNSRGVTYVVVGGFAVIQAGLPRTTGDIDLLVEASPENEARVFAALAELPDGCARELEPGDLARYCVVRVADEIVVDVMARASGLSYEEARGGVVVQVVDGVPIPFASPELLYRMKKRTLRERDRGDVLFLEELFAARGVRPPAL
jgi:hypothetical protein